MGGVRDWLGSGNVSARTFAERIIARAVGHTKNAILNDPVLAPDVTPKLLGLTISFDPQSGVGTTSWTGDSNTQSVSVLVSLSGIPSDADTRPGGTANTQVVNGQSGSFYWGGYGFTPAANVTLYAAAWAYSSLNGNSALDGLEAKQKAVAIAVFQPAAIPQGTINVHVGGTYDILGQGPPGTLSWKVAVNVGAGVSPPSLTTVRATSPVTPSPDPRLLALLNQGPATYGDKIMATLIAYSGAGGTGNEYPAIMLTGAYQNTTAAKYDTFPGAVFVPDTASAPNLVADTSTGLLAQTSGTPAGFATFALRVSSGLTLDSVSMYVMSTFASGSVSINKVRIIVARVPVGTNSIVALATLATAGSSGAVQLVSTGGGLGVVVDTLGYLYFAQAVLENDHAGGVQTLYSVTIGYIQNTISQGL